MSRFGIFVGENEVIIDGNLVYSQLVCSRDFLLFCLPAAGLEPFRNRISHIEHEACRSYPSPEAGYRGNNILVIYK